MCYDATSSFLGGSIAYGVAAFIYRRPRPRMKWCAIGLCGITAMQWVEGFLWLDGPAPGSPFNKFLTIVFIPIALLAQAWGTLIGSTYDIPIKGRTKMFYGLLGLAFSIVFLARVVYWPTETHVTPEGHLNWYSPENPPVFQVWSYSLWALVIGAPFLIWWRPVWQSLAIVSWGWLCAALSFIYTDSAASHWCYCVTVYAALVLVYSYTLPAAKPHSLESCEG